MGNNKNQINVKITDEQKKILGGLMGIMGGTEAEVIRNIFIAWLSENRILSKIIIDQLQNDLNKSSSNQ